MSFSAAEYDIIGGAKAEPGNWPWQIQLLGPAGCGGTLIKMNVS